MFFVEGEFPDKAIVDIFNDKTIYPHLVDLDENAGLGVCSCYDYQKVCPEDGRKQCRHIMYARRFRNLIGRNPKHIPPIS